MKRETLGLWVFLLAAAVCVFAAVIPVLRGRPMNVTSVAVGGFLLILALAAWARARKAAAGNGDKR